MSPSEVKLEPLDPEVLENLRRASTATLATQLFKQGLHQPFLVGVKPVNPGIEGFVGEATTMRFIPSREDIDPLNDPYRTGGNQLQWDAIENLQPGQVLVVDSRNDVRAASGGDILITRAMCRGAAAFVTDGAVRDGGTLASLPFPVYSNTVTATTRAAFHHVAELQVAIGCAGVAVYPGDVLVGDRDGIVVVPRALAPVIAKPAYAQEKLEAYLVTRIKAGEPLQDIYPPSAATLADYRATLTEETR